MADNVAFIKGAYEAFAKGDVPAVLAGMDEKIEWIEAEGFPTAGTYVGPDAIVQGVFMPLVNDWEGFTVVPENIIGAGDVVVSYGTYSGKRKATGKDLRTRFVHIWEVRDGKVIRFEQVVDGAVLQKVLA
jgi:ketosteroid isomerase-like protein